MKLGRWKCLSVDEDWEEDDDDKKEDEDEEW